MAATVTLAVKEERAVGGVDKLAVSYQSQQASNVAQVNAQQQNHIHNQNQNQDPNNMLQHQQQQQPVASSIPTMRLRDDPPPITPAPRNSRKRKTPPAANTDQAQQQQQQTGAASHALPPTHTMVHPPAHMLPQSYQYDYSTGGMPVQAPGQGQMGDHEQSQSPPNTAGGRALSSSKRAEQNRKAQRAFRERRDQHVKALESRSQLLDAALASADEANRRWEECRALVDQLRAENTALRTTLANLQMQQPPGAGSGGLPNSNGACVQWDTRQALHGSNAFKNNPDIKPNTADLGTKNE